MKHGGRRPRSGRKPKSPAHARIAILTHFLDGHSVPEIAYMTGEPEAAIYKWFLDGADFKDVLDLKTINQAESPLTDVGGES
jgi:hypothetical protein